MARTFGTHFVITANLTDDGSPAYLRDDGTWSTRFPEALVTSDETERDALVAKAEGQQRLVCDPYAFKVVLGSAGPEATTVRERIRASGPTTPIRRADQPLQRRSA
jgi:Protein of unknown function (DUF2849)